MLFMLAWLLWLYKYDVNRKVRSSESSDEREKIFDNYDRRKRVNEINLEESLRDTLDDAVSDHGNECLFISDAHHHKELYMRSSFISETEEKHLLVDEDTIKAADLEDVQQELHEDTIKSVDLEDVQQEFDFDFVDDIEPFSETISQNNEKQMRKATLSSQLSFKKSRGEDLDVSVENAQEIDSQSTVKQAKILSQQSFKRDRGDMRIFQEVPNDHIQNFSPINFQPVKRTFEQDFAFVNNDESYREENPTDNQENRRPGVSNLHMKIDSNETKLQHVSCVENEAKISPVTLLLNSQEIATPEDDEVEAAFKSDSSITLVQQKEEDMHYIAPHGTRVNIKTEPAGRIHSIVVKKDGTASTKVYTTSPRVRAVSPRVRVSSTSSPIHIHQNVADDAPLHDEMVHLVVDTHHKPQHKLHVQADSSAKVQTENVSFTPKSPVKTPPSVAPKQKTKTMPKQIVEEIPTRISTETVVESGNTSFTFDDQPLQNKEKIDTGKLSQGRKSTKKPRVLEETVAQPTDFDAIMKKRKKYVDTMDDAATLLGQIAHREDKLRGGGSKILSKHWMKVKEAVRTKKYLSFQDKPMKK